MARAGYRANSREEPQLIDLRSRGNHPFLLGYFSQPLPILVDVPIGWGRGLRVCPLGSATEHPFVRALVAGVSSEAEPRKAIQNELLEYYRAVQPRNAANWLDLDAVDAPGLSDQPPWALSMPWDVRAPAEWREFREQFALQENRAAGMEMTIDAGWHFWGPVNDHKLAIETERLLRLLESLRSHGYRRHDRIDGDVRAVVLRKGSDWRWQVAGGEHRAAGAAALGIERVPVRVLQLVDQEDAALWPGVAAGVFTLSGALRAFNSVFEGRVPQVLADWALNNRPLP